MSLGYHLTSFMCPYRSYGFPELTLNGVPVLDTPLETITNRIFNMSNYLSNKPIFGVNSIVEFWLEDCQDLELVNVLD